MKINNRIKIWANITLTLVVLFILLSVERSYAAIAQDGANYIRHVRNFDPDNIGNLKPVGLAYSPGASTFLVLEAGGPAPSPSPVSNILRITPVEQRLSDVFITADISDPINMVFDSQAGRLLLLDIANGELIEIMADSEGILDPASLTRHDIEHFGLQNPQGMTIDPENGRLFILDSVGPRLVTVETLPGQDFDTALVSAVDLTWLSFEEFRGIAFDPAFGHLYIYSPLQQELVELAQSGQFITRHDLSAFDIQNPRAMVFAPSGDLTDEPSRMNLYIADSGPAAAEPPDVADFQTYVPMVVKNTDTKRAMYVNTEPGTIAEFSLVDPNPPTFSPNLANYNATLVQTINAFEWDPPSPDSAGIVYLPDSDTLLISDSEVNEMPLFTGDNLFESTLTGELVDTLTTISFSDEPTGVTWNPTNKHLFFSDDTGGRDVFEMNPGPDQLYDTTDDIITSFPTNSFGSFDPEGVTYSEDLESLFIADGVNAEVYQVNPGANGLFDGVDDVVTNFDTSVLGLLDPEGIAFNPDKGTLYIIGEPENVLFEITPAGDLVQEISISAANINAPAGLAYAPSSVVPGVMNIYIVQRGVDNDSNPNENDGKVFEFTLPPETPVANDDNVVTPEETLVTIDVVANDTDPNQNLDPSTTNNVCSTCTNPGNGTLNNNGDGTFDYTPNASFQGNDSFIYEVCDEDTLCDTALVTITVIQPDDPPQANDDSATLLEDSGATIDVALNDSDPEGDLDPASANTDCTFCGLPAHGSLINNNDGTFDYTPNLNFNGSDSFVYEICDAFGLCDTATVNITVDPVNDPLVAYDDNAVTGRGTPVTIDVAANDIDPDDNFDLASTNTTCSGCSEPSNGALDNHGDGTFTYSPSGGFVGSDDFIYQICDTGGSCDLALVTITAGDTILYAANRDAELVEINLTSNTSQIVDTLAFGSQAIELDTATGYVYYFEDSYDSDADQFGYWDPALGTNTIIRTYNPAPGIYAKRLSFRADGVLFLMDESDNVYRVDKNNGDITSVGGVNGINTGWITGTGDLAFAASGTPYIATYRNLYSVQYPQTTLLYSDMLQGSAYRLVWTGLAFCDDLLYATHVEADEEITYALSAFYNINLPTGDVTKLFDLPTYVNDLTTCSDAIFANLPPLANDDSASTNEDTAVYIDVAANDSDPDSNLDYGSTNTTCASCKVPDNGILVNNNDGSFDYTPNPDFNGSDDFVYEICDGGGRCDTANVSITINSIADQPSAANDSASTAENTLVPIDVAANDSDPDGDLDLTSINTSCSGCSEPGNGILVNNHDGTFDYTPNLNFAGTDNFIYEICDIGGLCDTATVAILVSVVSDPPVALDDNAATSEDTLVTIDVAANDSDADDGLDLSSTNTSCNTCSEPVDGVLVNNNNGTFDYTPTLNFSGDDNFTYEICDLGGLCDTALVTITITPVADQPNANDDTAETAQGVPVNIDVAANDSDPDGDLDATTTNTTCGTCTEPGNGTLINNLDGTFGYTPNPNFSGGDSYIYEICDAVGLCDTATVLITVNSAAPSIIEVRVAASTDDAEERSSGNVTLNSSDLELVFDANSNQTVGMRFNLIDIPQGANVTQAYIQFKVDETNSETTSLSIEGQNTDNAATFSGANGNISTRARTTAAVAWSPPAWTTRGVAGPEQQTPDIAAIIQEIVNRPGWTSGNSLVIIITGTGERTAEAYNGDQAGAPLLHVEYQLGPPNFPPVAADDSATTFEDTSVYINAVANDNDPEGNLDVASTNTTCITCSEPDNGTLINNLDGSFDYTPNQDFNGSDVFVYEICDTADQCDTATTTITVTAVADQPAANDDGAITNENTLVSIDVAANDNDPDGDIDPTTTNTTCGTCSEPANGSLVNHFDGTFDYTPIPSFTGPDGYTYEICDVGGLCDTADVTITVTPVSDPPVAEDDTVDTPEDTLLIIDVAANDNDPDGDLDPTSTNTVCGTCSEPGNGTLVNNNDGTFDYDPDLDFNGDDGFVYEICDTSFGCDTASVTITVLPVADQPVANDDSASTHEETLVIIDVSINDSDPDGDLDITTANTSCGACLEPNNGTLINNSNGTFDYTPDPGFSGDDTFVYEICDAGALCDTATVLITVSSSNDTIIYGANREAEIFEINLTRGTSQQVGTLAFGSLAIEQDPETGYVYYFEGDLSVGGDQLAYWDPATGTNTIVRTYNPAPGFVPKRMAFRPDNALFMMDDNERVYRIDKLTGNLTTVGTVSGLGTEWPVGTGDLAFAPDGTPYVVTYRNLYSIQYPQSTLLYSNMLEWQGEVLYHLTWTGLAYCDGLLYASYVEADEALTTILAAMYSIDPATGVVTKLFDLPDLVNDLTSCSDPAPVPSAMSLQFGTDITEETDKVDMIDVTRTP